MIGSLPIFTSLPAILICSDVKLMKDSYKKMMRCDKVTDCRSICEIYDLLCTVDEKDNYIKFEKVCAIICSISFSYARVAIQAKN